MKRSHGPGGPSLEILPAEPSTIGGRKSAGLDLKGTAPGRTPTICGDFTKGLARPFS